MKHNGRKALSLLLSLIMLPGLLPGAARAAEPEDEEDGLVTLMGTDSQALNVSFATTEDGTEEPVGTDFIYGNTIYTRLETRDDVNGYATEYRWYYGDSSGGELYAGGFGQPRRTTTT